MRACVCERRYAAEQPANSAAADSARPAGSWRKTLAQVRCARLRREFARDAEMRWGSGGGWKWKGRRAPLSAARCARPGPRRARRQVGKDMRTGKARTLPMLLRLASRAEHEGLFTGSNTALVCALGTPARTSRCSLAVQTYIKSHSLGSSDCKAGVQTPVPSVRRVPPCAE